MPKKDVDNLGIVGTLLKLQPLIMGGIALVAFLAVLQYVNQSNTIAIAETRRDVSDLKNEQSDIKEDVSVTKNDIATIKENIKEIKDLITRLQAQSEGDQGLVISQNPTDKRSEKPDEKVPEEPRPSEEPKTEGLSLVEVLGLTGFLFEDDPINRILSIE